MNSIVLNDRTYPVSSVFADKSETGKKWLMVRVLVNGAIMVKNIEVHHGKVVEDDRMRAAATVASFIANNGAWASVPPYYYYIADDERYTKAPPYSHYTQHQLNDVLDLSLINSGILRIEAYERNSCGYLVAYDQRDSMHYEIYDKALIREAVYRHNCSTGAGEHILAETPGFRDILSRLSVN